MVLLHLYPAPALPRVRTDALLAKVQGHLSAEASAIDTEYCFNIDAASALTDAEMRVLSWLLAKTFEPSRLAAASFLGDNGIVLEVGPRMNCSTAWSTNAVSICHDCGLNTIRLI